MGHAKNLKMTLRRSYTASPFREDVRQRRSGTGTPHRHSGQSGTAMKKLCQAKEQRRSSVYAPSADWQ